MENRVSYSGHFITFEGIDGSGKSTQIERMKEFFQDRAYEVHLTREPGGAPFAEKIRKVILEKNAGEVYPLTELLLYLASRYQHTREVLEPKLKNGGIVISDRYADSSVAYQGGGRDLGVDYVVELNSMVTCGIEPDLTFLLKIPVETSFDRLKKSGKLQDRLEDESIEFYKKVIDAYDLLAEKFPNRIKVVDGTKNPDDVWQTIKSHLTKNVSI